MEEQDLKWQQQGACRARANNDFFVPSSNLTAADRRRLKAAKAVCASCVMQQVCLAYALDNGIPHGIWGGLTTRERNKILKARGMKSSAKGLVPIKPKKATAVEV